MKKFFGLAICLLFVLSANIELVSAQGRRGHYRSGGYVKGYTRKDGTYVSGHYRSGTQVKGSGSSTGGSSTYTTGSPSNSSIPSATLTASSMQVIDGDTFIYQGQKYRIVGVDTPEVGEAGYDRAKQRLAELLRSGAVTLIFVGYDDYGRRLVKVKVNGQDIAEILKREGLDRPKDRPKSLGTPIRSPLYLPPPTVSFTPPAEEATGEISSELMQAGQVITVDKGLDPAQAVEFIEEDEIPEPIARIIAQNEHLIEQNNKIIELLTQIANKN